MNRTLTKIFYFILPVIFAATNYATAYTMPVGIPNTTIDFEQAAPERPSDWSKEITGYYYIDLKNGTYSPKLGSETSPRKTIPNPIPAGSYVEIAGEYSLGSGGVINIYAEGDEREWDAGKAGPVWITSPPNVESTFTTKKVILSGSNIFLTNMTFKEHSFLQVGSLSKGYSSKNIVVRNNTIIGYLELASGSILSVLGNSEESLSNNVILFKNTIRDAGDVSSTKDLDAGLIEIDGYSSNVWVLDNLGYNASGSGVQLNPRPPRSATHNIYVGNNEFYDVRQSGLIVKYATNVVFSSNYIHDIISTPWSVSKGIAAQYEPEGLWIINNHIHDVEYGVRIASTYDVGETKLKIYTIGNIIHDIHTTAAVGTNNSWESAGIHLVGGHEHYVYNNLIFNAPNGINSSSYNHKVFIENNIIFDLDAGHKENEYGYNIWSDGNKGHEKLTIENNLFGSNLKIKLNNTIYEKTPLLTVDGYFNNVLNDVSVDDSNIDTITTLLLTTPILSEQLKDNGKNNSYNLQNAYIVAFSDKKGVNLDFLNNPRVLGTSIDIGPLEQDGIKVEAIIPSPPNNIELKIIN